MRLASPRRCSSPRKPRMPSRSTVAQRPAPAVVPVAELGERLEIAAVGLDRVRRLAALLLEVGQELGDFGRLADMAG